MVPLPLIDVWDCTFSNLTVNLTWWIPMTKYHVFLWYFVVKFVPKHYSDIIMGAMASQIISLTTVCWTIYSGRDQRKHQSSTSLAFVRGIHLWPVISPHKWPVTQKMLPCDDVIMIMFCLAVLTNGFMKLDALMFITYDSSFSKKISKISSTIKFSVNFIILSQLLWKKHQQRFVVWVYWLPV